MCNNKSALNGLNFLQKTCFIQCFVVPHAPTTYFCTFVSSFTLQGTWSVTAAPPFGFVAQKHDCGLHNVFCQARSYGRSRTQLNLCVLA